MGLENLLPLTQGPSSGVLPQLVLPSEPTAVLGRPGGQRGKEGPCFSSSETLGDKTGGGVHFEVAIGYFPSHHSAGRGLWSMSSRVRSKCGVLE